MAEKNQVRRLFTKIHPSCPTLTSIPLLFLRVLNATLLTQSPSSLKLPNGTTCGRPRYPGDHRRTCIWQCQQRPAPPSSPRSYQLPSHSTYCMGIDNLDLIRMCMPGPPSTPDLQLWSAVVYSVPLMKLEHTEWMMGFAIVEAGPETSVTNIGMTIEIELLGKIIAGGVGDGE